MTDRPIHLARFVKLVVEDALDRRQVRAWLDSVTTAGPSGVVATVQTTDDTGSPRAVRVIHRERHGKDSYLVPLTRDLTSDEVESIVRTLAHACPDLDFDVETNASSLSTLPSPTITMDQAEHANLCAALAKHKHAEWMRERLDAGWRYGPGFSLRDKTHPLLRPWEQLADRYRTVDLDAPQKLVDVLGRQGYAVVARDELERVKALLRGDRSVGQS